MGDEGGGAWGSTGEGEWGERWWSGNGGMEEGMLGRASVGAATTYQSPAIPPSNPRGGHPNPNLLCEQRGLALELGVCKRARASAGQHERVSQMAPHSRRAVGGDEPGTRGGGGESGAMAESPAWELEIGDAGSG